MNVLSLFDGISCARVALDRAGIEVNAYMSSEIEKNAIKVSEKNYPDIIRVGSVVGLEVEGQVDLLIGGSPCQDLSIAKKDRKGLEGNRSGLFWEYVRLKKECNPTYFILENVASMPKKDKDVISKELGVEPVIFNASLVSAQSRKRLFWTNIPFTLPEDKGILLKDILQPDGEVDERMVVKGKSYCLTASYSHQTPTENGIKNSIERKHRTMVLSKHQQTNLREVDEKAHTLCATMWKGSHANGTTLIKVGHIGTSDAQANRVYDPEGKSVTLSAQGGGLGAKTGLYKIRGRDVILTESPLQVLQEGRTELGKQSRKDIKKETGKDSTSRSTDHKAYFGKEGTKANCLTTGLGVEGLVVEQDRIRKLTPVECERLQGLPDNYTEGIAMTNRYKCLGNAFNVDVVAHILSHLK